MCSLGQRQRKSRLRLDERSDILDVALPKKTVEVPASIADETDLELDDTILPTQDQNTDEIDVLTGHNFVLTDGKIT